MKKLLLLLAFLSVIPVFAADNTHVNCAGTPLGIAYTNVYPQLALTGLVAKSHLGIINSTANAICCNVVTPSPINPPSGGNGDERCFPAASFALLDFVSISANVYCRTLGGTTSSGTLDVWTW